MAFFSIVIPTFNRANLIVPTLRSIQAQSFRDFEIIVVDDGSTDDTEGIVTDLNMEGLRYMRTENKERAHARNCGMRAARGEFVVFLDSDDLFEVTHLHVLYGAIKKNPSCNFFATKYRFLTPRGATRPGPLHRYPEGLYSYLHLLEGNFLACNFCVRRVNPQMKWFEEERKFSIMEDWMFLVQNLRFDKLYLVDERTVLLRDHEARSMNSGNKMIIDRKLIATQWIATHVALSRDEQKVMQAYAFYFCAIHAYLDRNRAQAIRFVFSAIKLKGLQSSYLLLSIKVLVGRGVIQRFKNER